MITMQFQSFQGFALLGKCSPLCHCLGMAILPHEKRQSLTSSSDDFWRCGKYVELINIGIES